MSPPGQTRGDDVERCLPARPVVMVAGTGWCWGTPGYSISSHAEKRTVRFAPPPDLQHLSGYSCSPEVKAYNHQSLCFCSPPGLPLSDLPGSCVCSLLGLCVCALLDVCERNSLSLCVCDNLCSSVGNLVGLNVCNLVSVCVCILLDSVVGNLLPPLV